MLQIYNFIKKIYQYLTFKVQTAKKSPGIAVAGY